MAAVSAKLRIIKRRWLARSRCKMKRKASPVVTIHAAPSVRNPAEAIRPVWANTARCRVKRTSQAKRCRSKSIRRDDGASNCFRENVGQIATDPPARRLRTRTLIYFVTFRPRGAAASRALGKVVARAGAHLQVVAIDGYGDFVIAGVGSVGRGITEIVFGVEFAADFVDGLF